MQQAPRIHPLYQAVNQTILEYGELVEDIHWAHTLGVIIGAICDPDEQGAAPEYVVRWIRHPNFTPGIPYDVYGTDICRYQGEIVL